MLAALLLLLGGVDAVHAAATVNVPGVQLSIADGIAGRQQMSTAIQVILALTVLSLAPAILVSMTAFIRIVIVLSMLRHAFGMQETPPNTVLVSLALFLTLFTMLPVLNKVNDDAIQPYLGNKIGIEDAYQRGAKPLREFMVRQTREQDLALMVEISHDTQPKTIDDIKLIQLIPAFMLNELRTAFQIGFVVFLPFLLIDLIVSSVLMSLGMMMVPPVMIALPLKVLMFVLIDGWNLIVRSLVMSFH
ncbi:MAG TPA: flagellar type III secretion system pore protein FliP [Burkholderiaceae bacterium]|nr:flagellar type III secretion system pore protein FliP [Burkholderiaceae bacterium]